MSKELIERNHLSKLIYFKNKEIEQIKGRILSIGGYKANKLILEILEINGKENLINKFRIILKLLKYWAKGNFIYGGKYGYLNGSSLAILTAKVILLFPHGSVPFLLEKFFFIYSTWNWKYPIKIEKLTNLGSQGWNLNLDIKSKNNLFKNNIEEINKKRKLKYLMPMFMTIITPGYPEQNTMFNVNLSTFEIIQRELIKGKIEKMN
uniref:polynucleotide adenylyltransferase n=1 Tax=Meloidogyne hapla TaxID=6305 RepID=A0A1I8B8K2_MELHA